MMDLTIVVVAATAAAGDAGGTGPSPLLLHLALIIFPSIGSVQRQCHRPQTAPAASTTSGAADNDNRRPLWRALQIIFCPMLHISSREERKAFPLRQIVIGPLMFGLASDAVASIRSSSPSSFTSASLCHVRLTVLKGGFKKSLVHHGVELQQSCLRGSETMLQCFDVAFGRAPLKIWRWLVFTA